MEGQDNVRINNTILSDYMTCQVIEATMQCADATTSTVPSKYFL